MSNIKELLKKIQQDIASLRRELAETKEEIMTAIDNGIRTLPKKYNELGTLVSRIMATDENLRGLYHLLYTYNTPSKNERRRLAIEFIAREQYLDENGELQKQLISEINSWLSHHRWSWKDKITKEWNVSPKTLSDDNLYHIAMNCRDVFMQGSAPPSAAEKMQVKQIIQNIGQNNINNKKNNNDNTVENNIETDQPKNKKRKISQVSATNNNKKNKSNDKVTKTAKTNSRQIRSDESDEPELSDYSVDE